MRHGRHPRHDREHHIRHDHHHLAVAFGQLRGVVPDLRKGREGDVLHRLHPGRRGHVLQLDRLVIRSERRRGIELSEEKLRYLVVEIRNQIGHHQTAPERRHLAQGLHAAPPAWPPVAQPPQDRGPRADGYHPLGHEAPDAPPGQRTADGGESAHERRCESHLRQQREAELTDENRVLHGAQGVQRQQQEEHRSDPRDLGHVIPARRKGHQRHQRSIERQRHGHIEEEYRLIVALRGVAVADQTLRKTAVHDHQQDGRHSRRDGHESEDVGRQQAQNDQPHGHSQQHRTDLLGHAPRHALRDLLSELSPQRSGFYLPCAAMISSLRLRMLCTLAIST